MDRKGVYVSMSRDEYEEFIRSYKSTIYRTRSAYARKLLLAQPVKVLFRNRSMDDLIEFGVGLRKDIRLILARDWLTNSEKDDLRGKMLSIEENLIQLAKQCSRK